MTEIKIDLNQLEQAHIIDTETKIKIEKFSREHHKDDSNKRLLSIFTTIWAIITGIGILLFVAANWQDMSSMIKTLFLVGSTLAFYGAWFFYTHKKEGYEKTGQALILLWSLSYGASIFLLNQIYNIGGDVSTHLLIWSLWVLPLAYVTQFSTIFTLGVGTLYAAVLVYLGENYFIAPIMYSLSFIILGFVSLTLVRYHTLTLRNFWTVLTFAGSVIILGNMILLTFSDFWNGGFWVQEVDISLYITLFIGLILWLGAIFFKSWKTKKIDFKEEVPFFIWLAAIVGLMIITTQALPNYDYANRSFLFPLPFPFSLYVFIMNILFFAVIGTLIYRGVQKEKAILVNTSILFFAVYLFGKYLVFAFDSKFGGAFVFITGWLVCMAIGWAAEHIRRRILLKMK